MSALDRTARRMGAEFVARSDDASRLAQVIDNLTGELERLREERSGELTPSAIRSLLLDEVADWGSQKAVAARMGVSPAYLSDVLLSRREPGPKVAAYFNLEAVTVFRPVKAGESA